MTGTSYGILAPLTNGVTLVVDEADFDAERWYEILERERITVWYTAPTAIRMLMKAGWSRSAPATSARCASWPAWVSPRIQSAVSWSNDVLGRPFHDGWWQTETGGIARSPTSPPWMSARDPWGARCPAWRRRSSAAHPRGGVEGDRAA